MAVYVDDMRAQFRNMIMCHMVADTLDELHQMADQIGIQRKWFQSGRHPHYDICLTKRAKTIRFGAKEITQVEAVNVIRRSQGKPL
jgi:hypothetical protein